MKKIRLKELFNIPNCLCYLRIILIPIFLHRYFLAGSKEDYYICATILIISGLSDFLDGPKNVIGSLCVIISNLFT